MFTAAKLFLGKYITAIEIMVIVLVLAFAGLQTVRLAGAKTKYAELVATVATERQARADQRAQDERHARAVEGQLTDTASAIRRESHETEIALRARVAALLVQLRNRPSRPEAGGEVAATPGPAAGNTGAGLYRQDGEFLAGEAASAAGIAGERDECRRLYESARETLKQQGASQ